MARTLFVTRTGNTNTTTRAQASFRWAGFDNVTTAAADNVSGFVITEGLLWESLKWPLNVARAAAASAAMAGDVPRENFLKYLE